MEVSLFQVACTSKTRRSAVFARKTSETTPVTQYRKRVSGWLYRGTSLIRNTPLLGPYSKTIPRGKWWSWGGGAVSHERGTPVDSPLQHRDVTTSSCMASILRNATGLNTKNAPASSFCVTMHYLFASLLQLQPARHELFFVVFVDKYRFFGGTQRFGFRETHKATPEAMLAHRWTDFRKQIQRLQDASNFM